MEIVILKQKNYIALKYLSLLLCITSASALRFDSMVEKNNNHRARQYLPKTEDVDKMRTLPVVSRGTRPKKKHILCNLEERGYDWGRKQVYEKLIAKELSISEQSEKESGDWRSCGGYQVVLLPNGQ